MDDNARSDCSSQIVLMDDNEATSVTQIKLLTSRVLTVVTDDSNSIASTHMKLVSHRVSIMVMSDTNSIDKTHMELLSLAVLPEGLQLRWGEKEPAASCQGLLLASS